MIIFTDGANYDDTAALICLLKAGVEIDFIVITANGWSDAGAALQIFTYLSRWFNRDFPIIVGSLYSLKDLDENHEIPKSYPQGKMFARTIPSPFLFELSIAYSYISWLPPAPIDQMIHNPDYMSQILELVKDMKDIEILSIGGLTDVALMLEKMEKRNQLHKIKRILQVGGGVDIEGTLFGIDRSKGVSYNIYLDPDAAQKCLKLAGEKIYWISSDASSTVQFSLKQLEDVISNSLTPEGIWFYITSRARLLISDDQPEGQKPDELVIWDAIGVILALDPELMTDIKKQYINIETCSSVDVYKVKCPKLSTCVTYNYDDDLGKMYRDTQDGWMTNVVYAIEEDKVRERFYEIFNSQEHTAVCPLRKPLGCYKSEEVLDIPPWEDPNIKI